MNSHYTPDIYQDGNHLQLATFTKNKHNLRKYWIGIRWFFSKQGSKDKTRIIATSFSTGTPLKYRIIKHTAFIFSTLSHNLVNHKIRNIQLMMIQQVFSWRPGCQLPLFRPSGGRVINEPLLSQLTILND